MKKPLCFLVLLGTIAFAEEADYGPLIASLRGEDPVATKSAREKLLAAGAKAIPALAHALIPPPSDDLIGSGGPFKAPERLPDDVDGLIGLLDDKEKRLRALHELTKLGSKAKPALPRLLELLPGSHGMVSSGILKVLATIGPEAKQAMPQVKALMAVVPAPGETMNQKINRELVSRAAAYALASIDPSDADAAAAARLILRDLKMTNGPFGARQRALEAMLRLGEAAVPVLVDACAEKHGPGG